MTNQEIIDGLFDVSEWISEMHGVDINDDSSEHIRMMFDSIDHAIVSLRNNISVEVLSYEEEGRIVYDIEHMVDDFANKLNELQPDGIGLEITFK